MTRNSRASARLTTLTVRTGLLVAAFALPVEHVAAQSSADLPPVVVQGTKPKPKSGASPAAGKTTVVPSKSKKAAAAPTAAEVQTDADAGSGSDRPNTSKPGLNLSEPSSSGSRLGLTPLETPATVDVISGETARERGQHSVVEAVTQNAPGFSSVAPPVFGSAYAARGFQGNNSVMQLYDGTRLFPGRGNITFPFNTWSVERIEVLHGPASVLYGEGAIGGVINVVPKKPITEGFFNEAQVFFDSNMTRRASLDSGGAVSKALSYRFNVSADASDGWVDRGDSENLGLSGAVRLQATEDLVFTVSHDYGHQEPMQYFGVPYRDRVFDPRTRENNYNVENSLLEFRDQWTQFKTEWTPSDTISFRNVAYVLDSRREFRNAEDYAWDPTLDLVFRSGSHIRQKQEQIGNRFDATVRTNIAGMQNETVVGFDVNRGDFGYASYFPPSISPVDPINPVPGLFPNPNLLVPRFESEITQKSFFAEDRLIVTPWLSLVGGVRWDQPTIERTDISSPAGSFEKDFHAFNWRAGAVITPVRNLSFYGQYAVATDPLNVPLLDYLKSSTEFDLTRGRQIEVGVKQVLWNGAFEWSLAGYEIVKTDLLALNPATFETIQIGQQSSRGIEAAVGFQLGGGWRVDANGALLRAQYDDFEYIAFYNGPPFIDVKDFSGNVPILVPEKTANIWLSWAFAPRWVASGGVQYVGASYENFSNTVERPSYTIANVGLQWKPTDATRLDFRVRNLFDKVYAPYLRTDLAEDGTVQGFIAPPRTFEAALSVRF